MAGWADIKAGLNRRRRGVIITLSALGHLALFTLVGLQTPQLREMIVPAQPALELRLIPPVRRHQAPAAAAAKAAPVQPRPSPTPPKGVATLPIPPAAPAPRGASGIGTSYAPAPLPATPGADLKKALRAFSPGCRNADAVGLTRRERDACDERLGRGSQTATYIPDPMDRAKRGAFDAQAAKDDAYRRYKQGNVPPAVKPGSEPGKNTGLGDDYAGMQR
jgi:hypothetical protein